MKIYVHVPFCHSKCAYCDFYSTPRRELMADYVEALGEEWRHISPHGCVPDTIYLGGGTPSSLPLPLLDRLIGHIYPQHHPSPADMARPIPTKRPDIHPLREFTIEANPEDVTEEWAHHIVNNTMIDRVSMGIQTFDDATLRLIGRRHSATQATDAINTLRVAGVTNLSCDLIYGLPGQTPEAWQTDLDRLIALRPEHISAYLLSYEPRTRLGVMLSKGLVEEASDTIAEQMYTYLCRATREAGYEHYEISNFALPGRRAIHNSSYWDGSEYIGLGPGAHSMAGGVRWHNPSDLRLYIDRNGCDVRVIEVEDAKNRFNDMLITSLRTSLGLDPAKVPEEFAANFRRNVARLADHGLLAGTPEGRILIPEDKWLTSDSILLQLIEV